VANSLDANGLSITCDDEETARRLAEAWHIGEGAKQRAVTLIPLRSEENWLTWSETRHKLDELLVARVDDRLNILEGLRQQWIDDFRARNSAGVAVRLALPRALGITAPTTFITTYVSGVPPHLAGGAAVVGGALDILTATPSARRTLAGLEAAAKAGLPWRDSSIRTGAARWLQEMLGRMW
jgi:hypothetical protein